APSALVVVDRPSSPPPRAGEGTDTRAGRPSGSSYESFTTSRCKRLTANPAMPPLIGSRIPRIEHEAFLRGRGRYVDDMTVPGLLHAAFVRSPHAHAAIRGVSKAAALALPGVHAVLTLDDLAPVMALRRMLRHSNSGTPLDKAWAFALADGEVSYVGETVAIVIADSRYVAEDAAALVDVDYDPLPIVGDVRKAVGPGAPMVRRELGSNVVNS